MDLPVVVADRGIYYKQQLQAYLGDTLEPVCHRRPPRERWAGLLERTGSSIPMAQQRMVELQYKGLLRSEAFFGDGEVRNWTLRPEITEIYLR